MLAPRDQTWWWRCSGARAHPFRRAKITIEMYGADAPLRPSEAARLTPGEPFTAAWWRPRLPRSSTSPGASVTGTIRVTRRTPRWVRLDESTRIRQSRWRYEIASGHFGAPPWIRLRERPFRPPGRSVPVHRPFAVFVVLLPCRWVRVSPCAMLTRDAHAMVRANAAAAVRDRLSRSECETRRPNSVSR